MKSVLVHINRDDGQEARFQAALDVVRAFEGHLTCLQVAPLEAYASIDPYGVGYLLTQTVEQIREVEKAEQAAMESRLAGEGVNWNWLGETGDPTRLIGDHSWLSDLVVVSQPEGEWNPRLKSPPVTADVVLRSRAPVLAMPNESRGFDCRGPVAIAWNGSSEACAAIRAAMPLLKRASSVHLLAVAENDEFDLPPVEASTYLARHGVASELVELTRDGGPISETVLAAATERDAVCLVTGAYGHSRLRENILGGVTRGLLTKAKLPLLLAH